MFADKLRLRVGDRYCREVLNSSDDSQNNKGVVIENKQGAGTSHCVSVRRLQSGIQCSEATGRRRHTLRYNATGTARLLRDVMRARIDSRCRTCF